MRKGHVALGEGKLAAPNKEEPQWPDEGEAC
jgi:hypothetical protein